MAGVFRGLRGTVPLSTREVSAQDSPGFHSKAPDEVQGFPRFCSRRRAHPPTAKLSVPCRPATKRVEGKRSLVRVKNAGFDAGVAALPNTFKADRLPPSSERPGLQQKTRTDRRTIQEKPRPPYPAMTFECVHARSLPQTALRYQQIPPRFGLPFKAVALGSSPRRGR